MKNKESMIITQILREFQKIDPEFPLQYALCLIEISQHDKMSLTELSEKTEMPLSTVSRIVGALSKKRQKGQAFGLINVTICPEERRRKEITLTTRGRAVIHGLHDIIAPA